MNRAIKLMIRKFLFTKMSDLQQLMIVIIA